MLTRITAQKIMCVYILCVYIDSTRYFLGLSLMRNQREKHIILGERLGKIWICSCWEKGNFIMINEFKYGQTWKIWPSPFSVSLYSSFKVKIFEIFECLGQNLLNSLCQFWNDKSILFQIWIILHCHKA